MHFVNLKKIIRKTKIYSKIIYFFINKVKRLAMQRNTIG